MKPDPMSTITIRRPEPNAPTLGVLGGLGPLASSRFVSSAYRSKDYTKEQQMPRIILYSDPTFPDRTDSFLRGEEDELLRRTVAALDSLVAAGATRLLICCFTLHHLVPRLPQRLQERLLPLPDIALFEALKDRERALILCTLGSRKLRVFESSPVWESAKERVEFPEDDDQVEIHNLIYKLKINLDPSAALQRLIEITAPYMAGVWIFGCTEFHLLSNMRLEDSRLPTSLKIIDPLQVVADRLRLGKLQTPPFTVT